jgi:thiol reductant ABC exporter CydC subunit
MPSSSRTTRRLLGMVGADRWWLLAAALFAALTAIAGIGLLSLSGALISRSALVDSTATLALAIVGVRFFAVVRAVGRYLERYVGHLATFRVLTTVRVWCYRGLEPLAPAVLVDDRSGDVLTRIVDDVETLQDLPLRVVVPRIAAVLAGGVGAVVLGVLAPVLGVVLVVFLLVCGVVVPVLARRLGRAGAHAVVQQQAEVNAAAVEGLSALPDLVAFGREDDLLVGRIAEATRQRVLAERRLARLRGALSALAGVLGGVAAVATFALAVPLVTQGRLDGVLLAVVPLATLATFEAVAPLAVSYEHADRAHAAADRLFALVDREPSVREDRVEAVDEVTAPGLTRRRPRRHDLGEVVFDRVTFAYREGLPLVLDEASFVVPAGATTALVGASGAGKSTIPALLLRFWEPQRGAIRIDGHDLRDLGSAAARSLVAVVAQHDHLFDTSVRDNLLLGDGEADDARLWRVLRAVALADVVAALPGGLAGRVGEDGVRLSGGQRQRLMIARALLAEAPVLVLDEATAHLDADTEAAVLAGVRDWRDGRTTIRIAHDADREGGFDLVLAVQDGKVSPVVGASGR